MGLEFVPGPGNAIFESREADSPWEPRRSGRRAWLAPRAGCAPPRRRGRGVAARWGLPDRQPLRLYRSRPPMPGSERTPRLAAAATASRQGPSPTRSGLLPPARAPPGERGQGAPSPPRRDAGTPGPPRPPVRPRVRRAPGDGGGGAAPSATPAPGGSAPRPEPAGVAPIRTCSIRGRGAPR